MSRHVLFETPSFQGLPLPRFIARLICEVHAAYDLLPSIDLPKLEKTTSYSDRDVGLTLDESSFVFRCDSSRLL